MVAVERSTCTSSVPDSLVSSASQIRPRICVALLFTVVDDSVRLPLLCPRIRKERSELNVLLFDALSAASEPRASDKISVSDCF